MSPMRLILPMVRNLAQVDCESPGRAESGQYGTMSNMKKDDVNAVLSRVLTWPAEAQQEAVASLRAIENEWVGGDYHATPQELKAIDEADRSGVATEDEVEAAFRSFRTA